MQGASCKIKCCSRMIKIQINKILTDKDCLLVCGASGQEFSISEVYVDQIVSDDYVLFFQPDTNNTGDKIFYFVVIIYLPSFNTILIKIENDKCNNVLITVNHNNQIDETYDNISLYVGFNWFNILKSIYHFGNMWHNILYHLDYYLVENLDHEQLSTYDSELYFRIKNIKKVSDLQLSQLHIETNDAINFRVEGNILNTIRSINILLDNKEIYRVDQIIPEKIYNGMKYIGIEFQIARDNYSSINPAISVMDDHGKIIYFRFLILADYLESQYRYSIDSVEPMIRGWAIDETLPGRIFPIEIFIDGVLYHSVSNAGNREDLREDGTSLGNGGFDISSPQKYLRGGEHQVRIRLPDGTLSESQTFISPGWSKRIIRDYSKFRNRISIIIPVYNAPAKLELCLESVLRHTEGHWRAIVIDDCSTNPEVHDVLSQYEQYERFVLMKHTENMGFSGTVNEGVLAAGRDDVIFLNADTRVTPGWLPGILTAASSQPKVATVTAMSDRAGAFSAPEIGFNNPLPEGIDEIEYAKTFRQYSQALYPHVPTGNGFCMYINREALDECGLMDKDIFIKAYGEENDFCMRALRRGWKHLVDDTTYIYHEHATTFGGTTRRNMVEHAMKLVIVRYPEYRYETDFSRTCVKMLVARYNARCAIAHLRKRMGLNFARLK